MGTDRPSPRGKPGKYPGESVPSVVSENPREEVSIRPVETKILISVGLILAGIAIAGRYGMLTGAAVGGGVAYGNFFLIRKILEKAFSGRGTVRKSFVVHYVLKFLGLIAVVYLIIRSGRIDVVGFMMGFSALFLGVLLEGLTRAAKMK